jgi:hypothetical protein
MPAGRIVALALLLALGLTSAPAATAQAAWQPPRAADGHPDLQGVWISRWLTPLERQPGVTTLALAPKDAAAAEKTEWIRHNTIDAIEGTDNFEFTHFVVVRSETRSSLIVDPPNGRLPYTEQARARQTGPRPVVGTDGPEGRALNERCLTGGNGIAPLLTAPSGNIRQIVQTPIDVVIWTELLSQLRIIPVDGRVESGMRREKATGHWDGDTLVVETTGIIDPTRGVRGSLFLVTQKTRITERFTRTAADEILYTFHVEDAALYTQPWTGETVMKRTDEPMFEFACHEGNYGLSNILSGARVMEARAAKAAKTGKP